MEAFAILFALLNSTQVSRLKKSSFLNNAIIFFNFVGIFYSAVPCFTKWKSKKRILQACQTYQQQCHGKKHTQNIFHFFTVAQKIKKSPGPKNS